MRVLHHHPLRPVQSHFHNAVVAVGVQDMPAVRSPLQGTDIGVGTARNPLGVTSFRNRVQVDFGLSARISYPGYVFAVGTPVRTPVVGTGAAGNVTKASQDYVVQESSIEYFLGQAIMKLRMVPKDVVQYRHNGDDVKYFLTKGGEKKLAELMKAKPEQK